MFIRILAWTRKVSLTFEKRIKTFKS